MIQRKLISLFLTAACAISLSSCKDDDKTVILPTLDGSISFEVPEYVAPGESFTMTPSGLTHPDGKGIGYYWKVQTSKPKADTTRYENGLDKNGNPSDGSFFHTFSDTTKTYTITCYGYAEGYSYTSKTKYSTVVKGGIDGSITNLGLANKPTVEIEGKSYPYVTVGNTDWMCRNIEDMSAGIAYKNCDIMSDVYGRYYSYNEAMTICPEGWELPTDADWTALAVAAGASEQTPAHSDIKAVAASLMGNAYFNDELMWAYWPEVGEITNSLGISMIPAGYAMLNENGALFSGYLSYAAFWTADKVESDETMAYYRYVMGEQPDLFIGKTSTDSFGASVRCIRRK